jgi:hypothetical protein
MEQIRLALSQLDVTNDNHWTSDGLPRIETLKFLTGLTLTRAEITEAAPRFSRISPQLSVVTPEVVAETVAPVVDEIKPDLLTQLDFENATLNSMYKEKTNLELAIVEQNKVIVDLTEQIEREIGVVTSQDAIQAYLANQRKLLEDRAIKLKMIADSGINLKDLSEGLKSPLDSFLSRKR